MLIPLLFMGDIVGRLFREFAVTLSVTILVSAVVSLTLTPMMCAQLLRHKPESEQGWFYRASERGFEGVIAVYGRTLRWVLRHQTPRSSSPLATLAATLCLYIIVPKGFPGAGYGRDPGRFRGAAERCRSPPWRTASRRSPT